VVRQNPDATKVGKPLSVLPSREVLPSMFHVKQRVLDFSTPRTKDGAHDSARQ